MATSQWQESVAKPPQVPQKSRGEVYESIGFNFCKVASVLLILEIMRLSRYALPIVASLAVILYSLSHIYGARESRCILKKPMIIAGFWAGIVALWVLKYHYFPQSY